MVGHNLQHENMLCVISINWSGEIILLYQKTTVQIVQRLKKRGNIQYIIRLDISCLFPYLLVTLLNYKHGKDTTGAGFS